MLSVSQVFKPRWVDVQGARFELKSLSHLGRMNLVELGNSSSSTKFVFSKQCVDETIRECLIGWQDVVDENNEPLEFNINTAFEYLDFTILSKLMTEIFTHSFILPAIEKK